MVRLFRSVLWAVLVGLILLAIMLWMLVQAIGWQGGLAAGKERLGYTDEKHTLCYNMMQVKAHTQDFILHENGDRINFLQKFRTSDKGLSLVANTLGKGYVPATPDMNPTNWRGRDASESYQTELQTCYDRWRNGIDDNGKFAMLLNK